MLERVASHGMPAWTATGPRDIDVNFAGGRMRLAASEREVHLRALDGMLEAALVDIEDEIQQHDRTVKAQVASADEESRVAESDTARAREEHLLAALPTSICRAVW